MTILDKLYRKLAEEYGLPLEQVEQMCRFQFLYLRQGIENGEFPKVRLPYLGVFKPMPVRVQKHREKQALTSAPAPRIRTEEEMAGPLQEQWFVYGGTHYIPVPAETIDEETKQRVRNEDSSTNQSQV